MSLVINKSGNEQNMIVSLQGRLDTTTSPELESVIDEVVLTAKELVLNFEKLEYISSAGLRVILKAQKAMKDKGSMKIIKVNSAVMEVFDITGFVSFLTIE